MSRKNIILILIIIALALFLFTRNRATAPTETLEEATTTVSTATTTNTATTASSTKGAELEERTVGGITFTAPKGSGVTIEQVPIEDTSIAKPKLTAPATYSASLDAAAKANIGKAITDLLTKVTANTATNADWVALGAYYKMAGDYKQAESTWKYVTARWPSDRVAHGNLGDLYAYYLKDNAKALTELKAALALDKTIISNYRNLFDFYTNVMKDTASARAILNEGIKLNPSTSGDLKVLLESI